TGPRSFSLNKSKQEAVSKWGKEKIAITRLSLSLCVARVSLFVIPLEPIYRRRGILKGHPFYRFNYKRFLVALLCRNDKRVWIPACAGMTERRASVTEERVEHQEKCALSL
ncbi:MAG: hypothetical protein LBQ18_02555, partial [Campylobacteraceae bacterium]|nr:hypothetical protein [Campylobacteraceae bacterium]